MMPETDDLTTDPAEEADALVAKAKAATEAAFARKREAFLAGYQELCQAHGVNLIPRLEFAGTEIRAGFQVVPVQP